MHPKTENHNVHILAFNEQDMLLERGQLIGIIQQSSADPRLGTEALISGKGTTKRSFAMSLAARFPGY